jgi:hypothetical protein
VTRTRIIAAGVAAALLVPGAALAGKPERTGKTTQTAEHGKAKGKTKRVGYLFKGTLTTVDATANTVTVQVQKGNSWARRYLKRASVSQVTFDLANATVVAADRDGTAGVTVADTAVGDKVIVHAKLAKNHGAGSADASGAAADAIPARRLVDLTSPAVPALGVED